VYLIHCSAGVAMQRFMFFVFTIVVSAIVVAEPARADDAGLADRTAAAHATDTPVATPAATTPPDAGVHSRPAIYTSIAGQKIEGWIAWPAGKSVEGMPALIVIHEWWGLNDNIRRASERLAAEGYITLAVDLYRGQTGDVPKQAMQLMQALNAEADAGRENLAAAYDYLETVMRAERIGVIGWCLGGRWSLQAALRLPEKIDATVIYYGGVTDDKEQLATLQMPILGLFAGIDPVVPPDTVVAFRDALADLGKDADIHIYPEAKHAFANPSGMAYDEVAAADAWEKTTVFLAEHLQ
jgi:carboxymethylenebutenolidase